MIFANLSRGWHTFCHISLSDESKVTKHSERKLLWRSAYRSQFIIEKKSASHFLSSCFPERLISESHDKPSTIISATVKFNQLNRSETLIARRSQTYKVMIQLWFWLTGYSLKWTTVPWPKLPGHFSPNCPCCFVSKWLFLLCSVFVILHFFNWCSCVCSLFFSCLWYSSISILESIGIFYLCGWKQETGFYWNYKTKTETIQQSFGLKLLKVLTLKARNR